MLHRFGFTFVALAMGAPWAFAGDDGKKESVESKLLEILRARQVINEAEYTELSALSARLKAELKAEEEGAAVTKSLGSLANSGTGPSAQGTTVKVAPGEGITIEDGTNFKININNKMMIRYTYSDLDNDPAAGRTDSSAFSIPRARTYINGSVWDPNITWRIALEYNEAASIKDAWVNWDFWTQERSHSKIGMRIGQQKVHFGKTSTYSAFRQEFVDRDIAATTFSTGRSRGAMFHGHHMEGGKLHWNAGMWNTDTAAGLPFGGEEGGNDNELNFNFGVRFDPWGDMGDEKYSAADLERTQNLKASFGAGLWLGNELVATTAKPTGADNDVTSINLNAAMKLKGFHALGEVFLREDDVDGVAGGDIGSTGWNVQGTYTLAPNAKGHQWGFGGRVSMISLDDTVPAAIPGGGIFFPLLGGTEGDVTDVTLVGSDFYKAHNMKTQVDVTFRSIDPDTGTSRDDFILRVQFTIQI